MYLPIKPLMGNLYLSEIAAIPGISPYTTLRLPYSGHNGGKPAYQKD
jgi:hypothetical protein